MESTVSAVPPPEAADVERTEMFEYPPIVVVAVKVLAPSASSPFVTT